MCILKDKEETEQGGEGEGVGEGGSDMCVREKFYLQKPGLW